MSSAKEIDAPYGIALPLPSISRWMPSNIKVFKSIKAMNTPVLLHVHTNKSKSIDMKTMDATKYYSLSGLQNIKQKNN